jgi:hypothetical protein
LFPPFKINIEKKIRGKFRFPAARVIGCVINLYLQQILKKII